MKLAQLFSIYKTFKLGEEPLREVRALSMDSRGFTADHVYIAIRGAKIDGHQYIPEICRLGAVGVVVESEELVPADYKGGVLLVKNSRLAAVTLASHFYGEPAQKLFCVGVTGTNGKTSTTYMIESILNHFGLSTGVIGTVNHHLGAKVWSSELTTPDPITLQKRLAEFVALDAKAVAFEVSSHAIEQGRADNIPFAAVVFTNLTRDHLDYHGTMENYFHAKEKLFRDLPENSKDKIVHAIININDEWGGKIEVAHNVQKWTYGEAKSDFQFQIYEMNFSGSRFHLVTPRGELEFKINTPGRHNVYNAVAAIAVGVAAGASLETCRDGIAAFQGVPGRLERVATQSDRPIFVDYAHTDDALRTVLAGLNHVRTQAKLRNRIITVFGCGGDRDKGKRQLMAQAAVEGSDLVFITSDNPRTEEPMSIIKDILVGVPPELMNEKVFVEVDRRKAIGKAIAKAEARDVVLIAGKGHENYQIIGTKRYDFSDVQVAEEALNGL